MKIMAFNLKVVYGLHPYLPSSFLTPLPEEREDESARTFYPSVALLLLQGGNQVYLRNNNNFLYSIECSGNLWRIANLVTTVPYHVIFS